MHRTNLLVKVCILRFERNRFVTLRNLLRKLLATYRVTIIKKPCQVISIVAQ